MPALMKRLLSSILICCVHTLYAQDSYLELLTSPCNDYCTNAAVIMGILDNKLVVNVYDGTNSSMYTYDGNGSLLSVGGVSTMRPVEHVTTNRDRYVGFAINDKMYFTGRTDSNQIYVWDGMLLEKAPIQNQRYTGSFITANNKLYHTFPIDNDSEYKTYEYDPATGINRLFCDSALINGLYFKGKFIYATRDSMHGGEFHFYEPATNTYGLLADIFPGKEDSYPGIAMIAEDKMFFTAFSDTNTKNLFMYDGVQEPVQLTNFTRYINSTNTHGGITDVVYDNNGNLYLHVNNSPPHGNMLYKFDIKKTEVTYVDTINYAWSSMCIYNNSIFYTGNSNGPTPFTQHLFKYNLTTHQRTQIQDPDTAYTFYAGQMKVLDGALFITGSSFRYMGTQLYRYYEEPPYTLDATIYPNPATAEAYVKLGTDTTQTFVLTMYDAMGREIMWRNLGTFKKGGTYHYPAAATAGCRYLHLHPSRQQQGHCTAPKTGKTLTAG